MLVGIFVGGRSTRMGGRPKGLLEVAGATLVARAAALAKALGAAPVLVGTHEAYAGIALPTIADRPGGIGPIGGLAALVEEAGDGRAIALACDMPHVDLALLERLVRAPEAAVVAPRRDGRWEPLCARYDALRLRSLVHERIAAGKHSLQGLLDACGAAELPPQEGDAGRLFDWDSPEDVRRGR